MITTSAQLKLREMIPNMIQRAQQITGKKKLIIVFDRGGYDIKLFETINHYRTVTFITWAKYISDKTLDKIPVEKYRNRQAKSLSKIKDKQQQLDQLKRELETVPAKISIIELLAGKKMSHFDLEKKKIYDVVQIIAYNSEQMLLKLFEKH